MELPQSRPFGTEGKKPTHDFLSLYNHSSFQHQDPRPSQGIFLKTRDFLQPLETIGKSNSKGEITVDTSTVEKPVAQTRPPSSSSSSSVEHVLPGGIGTYTISHISNFNQLVPKPEINSTTTCAVVPASSLEKKADVNKTTTISNSNSSYSGSSFSLWGESVVEKATTAKKGNNTGERHHHVLREQPAENLGQWSSEQPLQASTTPYIFRSSFSSLPSSKATSQKNQTFMDMMKSGKSLQEDEDDDEEFLTKKDVTSQKELTVRIDGKSNDQKANTPRSKHSATEQRRRSKINDRQILRDLIPLNDQKRDKASFLLEVIEYIQFLQEKVNKYEVPYQGWNQEPTKLMPWRNRHGPGESIADHSLAIKNGPGPGLMFAGKFNDHNIPITPPILANAQNPVENDRRTSAAYKPMDVDLGVANKAISLPTSMQPDMFISAARSGALAQPLQRPTCDGENMISKSETHIWQSRPCAIASGALNEQDEMAIEGGTISISNVYSQGLLNNLTKALQSSGVDLSQASISVQIDLGKQPISRLTTTKDHENPSSSNRRMARSRDASSGEDWEQAQKRLKTEKS
ncbi:Myc-type [Macleaya cordata]|uniref:Myc-type n=1 Tax=Macleaya cordata TaxID=56857 RepID=A0A200Q361_MACCD|nr:Myc-type [Macleaya cordata]